MIFCFLEQSIQGIALVFINIGCYFHCHIMFKVRIFKSKVTKERVALQMILFLAVIILMVLAMVISSGSYSHLIILLVCIIPIIGLWNLRFNPSSLEIKKSYILNEDKKELTIIDLDDKSFELDLHEFELVLFRNGKAMLVNQAKKKISYPLYKKVSNFSALKEWLVENLKVVRNASQSAYFN